MKGRLAVSAALAAFALSLGVIACGGDDDEGGGSGGGKAATDATSKLSSEPMTLTFLWFEWPPAQALEELGKEYTKTRPNVTVKVNTVPNPAVARRDLHPVRGAQDELRPARSWTPRTSARR